MGKARTQNQLDVFYCIHRNGPISFSNIQRETKKHAMTITRALQTLEKGRLIFRTAKNDYDINRKNDEANQYIQQQARWRSEIQVIPQGDFDLTKTEESGLILDYADEINTNVEISFLAGKEADPETLKILDDEDRETYASMFLSYWAAYLHTRLNERLQEEVAAGNMTEDQAIKEAPEILKREMKKPFSFLISNKY